MAGSSTKAHDDGREAVTADPRRYLDALLTIGTHLSHGSAGSGDVRMLYAMDVKGSDRSSAIIRKISSNRFRGMATSAIWKAT